MTKKMQKFWLIIINSITLIRLIGALALPFIFYYKGASICAIWTIVFFLTDMIDGTLARTLKLSTFFGAGLDAACDKLLNTIAFIILGIQYKIMLVPLILEVAILYTTYSTYRYGGNLQTSQIGKIKTIFLDVIVIICFILIGLPTLGLNIGFINHLITYTDVYIQLFSCIIITLSFITLYNYMIKNNDARKHPEAIKKKLKKKKLKTKDEILSFAFDTEYYQKHKNESALSQFYK